MRERMSVMLIIILLVFACLAGLTVAQVMTSTGADWLCHLAGTCP